MTERAYLPGLLRTKIGAAVLVIVCLAIIAAASLRAGAAWNFFAARTISANMERAQHFSQEGIDNAIARLDLSLASLPGRPDYLDHSGRLRERAAMQPGVMGRERRDLLRAAASDYRKALAARPLWPYSWASLLHAGDLLGPVDAEFRLAMRQSARTGPWEPQVQLQLLRSGIRHWEELGAEDRTLVQRTLVHALRIQPREVFDIVRFYARPDLICHLDVEHAQIQRWCAEAAAPAAPG
jgi:hypothetical protein